MEELLASQTQKITSLHRGQQMEGEILAITDKEITIDLNAKSEGILPIRDFSRVQNSDLKIGGKLTVFVSQVENEHGQVMVSLFQQTKNLSNLNRKGKITSWNKFVQAKNQQSKFQGVVIEVNKGGLIVEVDGIRGFLPNSQVGYDTLSKARQGLADLVGQTLILTVIEVDQNNNKLIFTQRGQISDEMKEKLEQFKNGQRVTGKVVAVLPFGLVVDAAGAEGLIFISDVSWQKIDDLSKEFKAGQELGMIVIGIDNSLGRLNLSLKQLSEDPFVKLMEKYPTDEPVKAEVVAITDAGVVFKLQDGVEGFMNAVKMDPQAKYEVGQSMTVLVGNVDSKKRRIELVPFLTSTEGLIYK